MRLMVLFVVIILVNVAVIDASQKHLLDPDFEIATEAGRQVFREELAIALTKTPGATPETRKKFKKEAEELVKKFLRKGQKNRKLKHVKLTVYWDYLHTSEAAIADAKRSGYVIHLNEILFFTYYEDHRNSVIPHEVAHLLHHLEWGYGNPDHTDSFKWIVESLVPQYKFKEFDYTPACRLSMRLLAANGAVGFDPWCDK